MLLYDLEKKIVFFFQLFKIKIKKMEKQKPELKYYLHKKINVKIHGKRSIIGILSGYDEFLNLVLDDAYDVTNNSNKNSIGQILIWGNSILNLQIIDD